MENNHSFHRYLLVAEDRAVSKTKALPWVGAKSLQPPRESKVSSPFTRGIECCHIHKASKALFRLRENELHELGPMGVTDNQ